MKTVYFHNDLKFLDSLHSVVQDQTAPDRDLQCLQFCLHLLDTLLYAVYGKTTLFKF